MKTVKTTLIALLAIVVVSLFFRGVASVVVETQVNNQNPTVSRQSYLNVQEKACIGKAVKEPNVTQAQATQYCKCVNIKIFGDKPMAEMEKINTQLLTGVFTPEQEDIVVECASSVL